MYEEANFDYYHQHNHGYYYPPAASPAIPYGMQYPYPHYPPPYQANQVETPKSGRKRFARTDRICNLCSNSSTACWYKDKVFQYGYICRPCYDRRNRSRKVSEALERDKFIAAEVLIGVRGDSS